MIHSQRFCYLRLLEKKNGFPSVIIKNELLPRYTLPIRFKMPSIRPTLATKKKSSFIPNDFKR